MKHLSLSVAVLALSFMTAASADPSPPAGTPAGPMAVPAMPATSLALGTDATPGGFFLGQPFQASVNSDTQTVTLTGSFRLFGHWMEVPDGYEPVNDHLSVTISTPLTQDADFTNTTTLDGLIKATSVSFSYSLVGGTFRFKDLNSPADPDQVPTWVVSLNGKVGTQHHEYFDPLTLAQHTLDTTPWQVGGSAGYFFGADKATKQPDNMALNLTFSYQQFYQDGDTGESRTLCLTVDNCVTGFIGAPVRTEKALITGDFRWIGAFGTHPIGLDVSVTYDPITDAESVQIPLYLMTDGSGALTGGLRYNWSSESHLSTIGVFASTAFDIGGQ
jgi:hypothetical protein